MFKDSLDQDLVLNMFSCVSFVADIRASPWFLKLQTIPPEIGLRYFSFSKFKVFMVAVYIWKKYSICFCAFQKYCHQGKSFVFKIFLQWPWWPVCSLHQNSSKYCKGLWKILSRSMNPKNWYKGLRRERYVYTLKREMLLRSTFDTPLYSSCSLFVIAGLCLIKPGGKMGLTFTKR